MDREPGAPVIHHTSFAPNARMASRLFVAAAMLEALSWAGLLIGLCVAAILMLRRFYAGLARGDWTRARAAG